MGVPDYKKIMVDIKKWDSGSKANEKARHKELTEATKAIEKATQTVRMQTGLWSLLYQEAYTINREWYPLAEKLIEKQGELKAAVKSKDKATAAKLKQEIEKMDKQTQKTADKFGKAHEELAKLDKELSTIIKAAKLLPS